MSSYIGAQLNFTDARITCFGGPAVLGHNLSTVGNAIFLGMRAEGSGNEGTISLSGARVGGDLYFQRCVLTGSDGPLIDLASARVDRRVLLPVSAVCPQPSTRPPCPHATRVRLDGFTFGALFWVSWSEWLHLVRCHTPYYNPGPYQQLAAVERAAGHDGNARRVLVAQQRDIPPDALGGLVTLAFHRLWGVLAGYGYQARRTAGALLVALAAAGVLGFWAGHVDTGNGHHTAERTAAFGARTGQPCTTAELVGVGLDRGLPFSPTGVRARCDINPDARWGEVFTVAIWVVQAAIWGLATLALAGYTALVRKPA